jgi:hydrogenase maturation protease
MLAVIGCGNLNRRDDGVGPVVAGRVQRALPADRRERVSVFDAGTDGMAVMYRARGATELVVVDASRSGAPPGSIHEVPGDVLENPPQPSLTLHDFRWDHALYVGRRLYGDAFPRSRVFLIEAGDLSYGLELSAAVEQAAARVTELVLAWIEERIAHA